MTDNIVKKFSSSEFGELRVVKDEGGEPWFVATDIAKTLGYRDAEKLTRRLSEDEKATHLVDTLGGQQRLSVINEAGLYRAILVRNSGWVKDPQKRAFISEFQRWVTHEVLPSIRRDGGYMVAGVNESPEETMARALLLADKAIKQKDARIAELEPKALFADAVTGSKNTCLVAGLAKILTQNGYTIGQNRLFEKLRAEGYLGKKGSHHNVPTQRAIEMGLFEIRESAFMHSDGRVEVNLTPRVTQKGVDYFIKRYVRGGDQLAIKIS